MNASDETPAQEIKISFLQKRIRALEKTVAESDSKVNLDYGTPFSFYGLRKEMPISRSEMALEVLEIFEQVFAVKCTEEELLNFKRFELSSSNARDVMEGIRNGIARLYQDFMFAQTVRKQGTDVLVFGGPLESAHALQVLGTLESLSEYFFRMEEFYKQLQRRALNERIT